LEGERKLTKVATLWEFHQGHEEPKSKQLADKTHREIIGSKNKLLDAFWMEPRNKVLRE
jgi:hypothetical protein